MERAMTVVAAAGASACGLFAGGCGGGSGGGDLGCLRVS